MVRWRYALVLAMLLLLPTRTGSKLEEDEEEERGEDADEDDDDDEDDEDEESTEKVENLQSLVSGYQYPNYGPKAVRRHKSEVEHVAGRRAPAVMPSAKALMVTRTSKKRPIECYVCAYKSETPLRACLDPTKYRVHTITCHSADDKCFTSVISKGPTYEAVVRGCRSGCVGSPETTCCELNRCNNQAFAMPVAPLPRVLTAAKAVKVLQPTVFFFVTILLVLQTVVKVAFV